MPQTNGRRHGHCCHHRHHVIIIIVCALRTGGSGENCQLPTPGKHPTFHSICLPSQAVGLKDPLRHPGFNVTLTSTYGGWGGELLAFLSGKHPRNLLLIPSTKRAPISVQGEQKIRSKAWTLRSLRRRQRIRPLAGPVALPAPSQIPCSNGLV